jgi:mannosyltransferase
MGMETPAAPWNRAASWAARNWRVTMSLVLLAAMGLRLFHLAAESLWIDEGFTAYLVTLPTPKLFAGLISDRHPPLYFLLLKLWTTFTGTSELALRYFSVVTSILTAAAAFPLARRLAGRPVGLTSAALLALAPLHIWYAQEARMYSLLALLAVLHVGLAWRLLKRSSGVTWLAYVLVGAGMFYTAYISVFVLAFEILVALFLAVAGRRWRFLAKWAAAQILIGLLALPWLPVLIRQMGRPMPWAGHPGLAALGGTLLRVFFGAQEAYLGPAYLLAVCLTLLLLGLGGWLYLQQAGMRRESAAFAAAWVIVPLGLIAGISQVYPIYQNKQLLMLLPGMLILAAMSLRGQGRRLRLVSVALLCSLWAFALSNQCFTPQKQDWRGVAAYIDQHGAGGDVIYVNASGGMLALDYYLRSAFPVDAYPSVFSVEDGGYAGETATAANVDARLSALVRDHRRVWLIQVSPEIWDPKAYIPEWLEGHCRREPIPDFYALDVRLYLTPKAAGPAPAATGASEANDGV